MCIVVSVAYRESNLPFKQADSALNHLHQSRKLKPIKTIRGTSNIKPIKVLILQLIIL